MLWLIGLLLLKVPLAPLWALIAGLMTMVPNIGGVIALLGPAFSILVSKPDMYRLCFLLGMYAVIVVIDQLMLQPLIMKRVTRVPVWASILVPIVLGIVIPFWGILLAPPLLAIVYAFRRPGHARCPSLNFSFPLTNGRVPHSSRFWLEWDSTALDLGSFPLQQICRSVTIFT